MAARFHAGGSEGLAVGEKLAAMNWGLLALLTATAGLGCAMLYSAAGGDPWPWALPQAIRFAVGVALMLALAMVDIRRLYRLAYPAYGLALLLLLAVEVKGSVGMGAQRWIELPLPGFSFRLQPSEVMKVALVLALARYFHGLAVDDVRRWTGLLMPLVLIGLPAVLVLRQPDLGTAAMIVAIGAALMFLAGIAIRWFAIAGALALGALPVAWTMLHAYQQDRVRTFFDPSLDPLGAGYHITQSKIALGSGGLFGKGFLAGTQSHLNFLPEKQTDFIFTMLAEELGMIGALALIALYLLIAACGLRVALASGSQFGRLLAMGAVVAFLLYAFINIAMVTGLVPVVGVPLPLISYGGSAMLTLMIAFGLLASAHIHRDTVISRRQGVAAL